MRIVAILNQKGGVGKTTTSVNLGAALARSGLRVLLIDCDSQANLTDHLGIDTEALGSSVYDVLTDGAPISESVAPTSTEGLFVLPADEDLAAAEPELAGEMAREFRLQRALRALDPSAYDWVLIDCPPSLGLLSLNAMAAADELLITVQTEYFAMRGLGQIDQVISMVQEHVNRDLRILGILPTLVSPVTRLAREVLSEIEEHYGPLVFRTRIRQNVRLAEAPGHQVHIFDYDPTSAGAQDYGALGVEVEARVNERDAAARRTEPEEESVAEGSVSVAEGPVVDIPVVDIPVVDIPVVDIPVVDVPVVDVPVVEVPAAVVPVEPTEPTRGVDPVKTAHESSSGTPPLENASDTDPHA